MGLNDDYQVLRSTILMLKPLPSVSQASSMILQEEQQKEIRHVVPSHPVDIGASGFLSQHSKPFHHSRQPQFHPHSHVPSQSFPSATTLPRNKRPNVQCAQLL